MDTLSFKYRHINGGNVTGFTSKKGAVTPSGLQLDNDRVPFDVVQDTTTRDNRIIVVVDPRWSAPPPIAKFMIEGSAFAIEIYGKKADDVEREIDRHASRIAIDRKKQQLADEGRAEEFKSAVCPSCTAVVDLCGLPDGRYTYCRFCLTLFETNSRKVVDEKGYRTCDECGMFDRIQPYTEFYFYFLLVLYGFQYKRRHMCDACAGRLFWKVFFLNALFLLGVPPALWLKAKSMRGKPAELKKLARANALARKGQHREADAVFAEVSRAHPHHPGFLYNQALGHLVGQDARGGARLLEKCLEACPNYMPALALTHQLTAPPEQHQLGA